MTSTAYLWVMFAFGVAAGIQGTLIVQLLQRKGDSDE
jgi:hypothetical protein